MALQRIGERDVEWCMRTAMTGICAPAQLTAPESAVRALELPEAITASLLCEVDRHAEPFRVWRQAFGYGGACHWLQLARRARAIPALGY